MALVVGDALAGGMANQRVGAIDFNPGGGALEAVASEERAARYSMLQLYRDREKVRSMRSYSPTSPRCTRDWICSRCRPTPGWP